MTGEEHYQSILALRASKNQEERALKIKYTKMQEDLDNFFLYSCPGIHKVGSIVTGKTGKLLLVDKVALTFEAGTSIDTHKTIPLYTCREVLKDGTPSASIMYCYPQDIL